MRRLNLRVVVGLVTAGVIAMASLAATSGAATRHKATGHSASGTIRIAYISWSPELGVFFTGEQLGVENAGRAMHVQASYDAPTPAQAGSTSATATAAAVRDMQAVIASHPSAIIMNVFFPSAEIPILQQAVKAGIPVFMANGCESTWQEVGALGCFGQNEHAAGKAAGEQMAEDGVKNAICVNDVIGNPSLVERCNGFIAGMRAKGAHATTDVVNSNGASDPQGYTQDVVGLLSANHSVQGVYTTGADESSLALAAVAQSGRTIKVATADLSKTVIKNVASGKLLFAINQQPYLQGYLPVVDAVLYLKYGLRTVGDVSTGPEVVTKSNIKRIVATEGTGVQGT